LARDTTREPPAALRQEEPRVKVQVLGTGCARCQRLYAEAEKAVSAAGVTAELEKVDNLDDILRFGVAMTPALVVDGQVKSTGRIPPVAEISSWLTAARAKERP
jgi:small redox-active disulfide protein 2